jgi:hypothetical protein
MRRVLVLSLVFLAACASSDGFVDSETRDCSSGGDMSVDIYLNMPKVMMEGTHDDMMMMVALGNNSGHDIEVKSIRVEPGFTAQSRYAIENSYREFNKLLAPGEDYNFELPVRGAAGQREITPRAGANDSIEIALSVYLTGGVTYRCKYDLPTPQ